MNVSSIRLERTSTEAVLRVLDVFCISLGFLAAATHAQVDNLDGFYLCAAGCIGLITIFGEVTGLYRSWRGTPLYRELNAVFLTIAYSMAGMLVLGFFASRFTDFIGRASIALGVSLVTALMIATRVVVRGIQRTMRARGYNMRRFAIVGVTELGIRLAKNLENSPELGLSMLGFFDDRPLSRTRELPADVGTQVGNISELVELARQGKVDRVYLTFPMRAEKRIRDLLYQFADTPSAVYIVPDFFVFELLHSRWTDVNGLPAVSVFENPFYGVDGFVKRVFDLVVASIALAVLFVPMVCIAGLIKLTSPGPVFFRQKRYGLDGNEIMVWKFRSMRVCENGPVIRQATQGDPRVTRFGAFLRRSSLDELPQLFNVLEGSMSLVGPRPHAAAHNEHYRRLIPGYMLRHKVKPGITGLAQVRGWRGETDTIEKMVNRVQCDHQYIREWSLWMDITILFKTLGVVISKQNAY